MGDCRGQWSLHGQWVGRLVGRQSDGKWNIQFRLSDAIYYSYTTVSIKSDIGTPYVAGHRDTGTARLCVWQTRFPIVTTVLQSTESSGYSPVTDKWPRCYFLVASVRLSVACVRIKTEQVAQLSQTDRGARCVSVGQKWRTGTGRQYFADISCSSWAHWKARSGLPISVNRTFFARCYGWGATSENRSKIGDFAATRSVWPKISDRRGGPPCTNHFCTDSEDNVCLTTLPLTVFTQRNFVADFLEARCDFRLKSCRRFSIVHCLFSVYIHRVRKKRCHFIFACNSAKC